MGTFFRKRNLAGLLAGIICLVLFFRLADFSWKDVLNKLTEGGLPALAGISFFTAVLYFMSALKWQIIVANCVDAFRNGGLWSLYHHVSLGYLFALILPQAVSDVSIRSYALQRVNGVKLIQGTYTVLLDQFTNILISLFVIAPGLGYFTGVLDLRTAGFAVFGCLITGGVIFSLFNRFFFNTCFWGYSLLIKTLGKIPYIKKFIKPRELFDNPAINRMDAFMIFLISTARHGVMALRLYVIVYIFNLNIDFVSLFICSSTLLLLGLVVFIPAQLGLGELGWYGALKSAGMPDGDIAVFVLSARIFSNIGILLTSSLIIAATGKAVKIDRKSMLQEIKTGETS